MIQVEYVLKYNIEDSKLFIWRMGKLRDIFRWLQYCEDVGFMKKYVNFFFLGVL